MKASSRALRPLTRGLAESMPDYICKNCLESYDDWHCACPECGEDDSIVSFDEWAPDDELDASSSRHELSDANRSRHMAQKDDVDYLFDRAKEAYRRERQGEQDRIRRDERYAYDWTQSVIGFLTAILNAFTAVWNAACYITTAVTVHLGMEDDCHILTVLRNFRDSYILGSGDPSRIEELQEYYRIAPEIISRLYRRPDSADILASVANTILVAVEAIEDGREPDAYEIYKSEILGLWYKLKEENVTNAT